MGVETPMIRMTIPGKSRRKKMREKSDEIKAPAEKEEEMAIQDSQVKINKVQEMHQQEGVESPQDDQRD